MEQIVTSCFNILESYRKIKTEIDTINMANDISMPMPRLTSVISETLIQYIFNELALAQNYGYSHVERAGNGGDLIGIKSGLKSESIEVKSSGISEFQYLGKRDLAAKWLVWCYFGDYINGNNNIIKIRIFEVTKCLIESIPKSGKISWPSLKKKIDECSIELDIQCFELHENHLVQIS